MGKARDFFWVRMWIVSRMTVNCDMSDCIVQTSEMVTLVGAGKVNKGILTDSLAIAPFLVAADGGAEMVLNCGKTPKKVIGDFDSIPPHILERIPAADLHKIPEQETTDFDKCLYSINAPLILGVGFLGGRVDHQMASLSSLLRYRDKPCILIGKHDVIFHLPDRVQLDLPIGLRFSLFPLLPVSGRSDGLVWPIDGLTLAPGGRIGTSNEVKAKRVVLEMEGPGLLAILPRQSLGAAVQALSEL